MGVLVEAGRKVLVNKLIMCVMFAVGEQRVACKRGRLSLWC